LSNYYYTKAIELNPEYAIAYENLSELYITTGNYKSALETITKALSLSLEIEDRAVCLYLECIA
jgi:tetratricopeptide (TPR) repeat protein